METVSVHAATKSELALSTAHASPTASLVYRKAKPWEPSLGGRSGVLPRCVKHTDRTKVVETCRFALHPHYLRPCVASATTH